MVALYLALATFTGAFVLVAFLYWRSVQRLKRYSGIANAEAYQAKCEADAQAAVAQREALLTEIAAAAEQLTAYKTRVAQYQQLLGRFQSVAELQQRIERDTARVNQLAQVIGGLEQVAQLNLHLQRLDAGIAQKQAELDSFSHAIGTARSVAEIAARATYYENYLAQLKADVEAVEEAKALQEFGFYRPRYNFDTSEHYQRRLDQVRDQQKRMLSQKTACTCTTEWTVDGSKAEGKKMVDQQIKLMLRAFNGECDAAVSKARYNNVVSLENRLRRSFDQISKLGEAKRIFLSREYLDLKLQELHLAYEYQLKKEEEKEEQRAIRERMREEQKVAKEIEKACEAAEREEAVKARALEQARQELAAREGQNTARLEELVNRLENELREAIERKAKAIARAQLTRSGHVYVLSNIGAFGEGVYKIGMSRRREPLERVAELGSASVPFPFDVHAMIYSEDAPSLEAELHRRFADRRVNLVNMRREFFRVTLDEIRAAVAECFGHVTFVTVPEAAEYRETLALLKERERPASHLQIA